MTTVGRRFSSASQKVGLDPTHLGCPLSNSLTQTALPAGMAVGVAEGAREVGS